MSYEAHAMEMIKRFSPQAEALCKLQTHRVHWVYYRDTVGFHVMMVPMTAASFAPYHKLTLHHCASLEDVQRDIDRVCIGQHGRVTYRGRLEEAIPRR